MKLKHEINIQASSNRAWKVLGEEFGSFSDWSSALSTSFVDGKLKTGSIRTCQLSGDFGPIKASTIKEQVITYNPKDMTLEYEVILGLPKMMKKATNRWVITAIDANNCRICSEATITLRGPFKLLAPLIKLLMSTDLGIFYEELEFKIANGYTQSSYVER